MPPRRIVVAAHGHCFDGIVSAAMFTHLRRHLGGESLTFSYRSCGYGPRMQVVPDRWLKGDENAIVDFRFAETERLTWYFDHHVTAFANDEQRDRALSRSKRYFFDPSYGSCTQLIVDVGRERYGVDFLKHEAIASWADRIDRAAFVSAEEAVDRSHPVKQLAAVVEQHGNAELYQDVIPRILAEPLDDICASESIQARWRPIEVAQNATRDRIEKSLEHHDRVVFSDLSDAPLEGSGKFVAYALAPRCTYSVALIRMKQHFKVSVGYNPWSGEERHHDIAEICRRHGGGGHPVVGAVSVPIDRLDRARAIARTIIAELDA
jgi:hypothetical protein